MPDDPQLDLLADLTEPQQAAATHVDGPLLIIAGAGSGKTRVITRRVAYLIAQGIPAWSVAAITFTNKAAGEMKARVGQLAGRPLRDFGRLDQPWTTICTFHSLCLRILKHYGARVGLPPGFSIFDSADQTKLIKEALKLLEMSSQNFTPATIHATISNAKNQLLSAEAYAQSAGDFYQRTVARVFTKYQKLLNQNNALDFDDLLLRTAQAFRDHPDVLRELQERFQYLMIDEYQDTNRAQYVLAHALAQKHRNICVVGDPDQSVYGWRGADIQNILQFEKDYPDAVVVRLEQNYRSSKTILRVASQLIARNTQRKEKLLWTENPDGEKVLLLLCQDEHDEADQIMRQLRDLHQEEGYDWNKMAIFYRMNSLSRVMEDALRRANVPYQIARGVEFYNRKEIKDVLAFLRVVSNFSDEVSLTRIVNVPTRGIGDAAIKQLSAHAFGAGLTLWQAMEQAANVPVLSSRAVKSMAQFQTMVSRWREKAAAYTAPTGHPSRDDAPPEPDERDLLDPSAGEPSHDEDLLDEAPLLLTEPESDDSPSGRVKSIMEQVIRQSGYEAYLRKNGGEEQTELANVDELLSSAAEYDRENPEGSLDEYLGIISLVSDADHVRGAGGAVTLMTLHAAKGLEFPVVAMIGLEDGILPHSRTREKPEELEEERRLCFVGITRAQERLILSKAAVRTIRGLRERTASSAFLAEMPIEDLAVVDRGGVASYSEPWRRSEEREAARTLTKGLAAKFQRGQKVRHPTFGVGKIAELSDMGQQTRAVVEFDRVGRKTLILEYARLETVA